ncbi:hypothetical protein [Paenibacillus riograndensis]|uniref:hypothetical protein n=1 Tax=Paenibacillus riograndensis TaxID=483937 RepID=UPI00200AED42|nr:hypothetical protein [Paenibacillus riograndensis]
MRLSLALQVSEYRKWTSMPMYGSRCSRVYQTKKRGNPQATAEAVLKVVDAAEPPLRFALGSEVLPMARGIYANRLATWEDWETVSNAAQGHPMQ